MIQSLRKCAGFGMNMHDGSTTTWLPSVPTFADIKIIAGIESFD